MKIIGNYLEYRRILLRKPREIEKIWDVIETKDSIEKSLKILTEHEKLVVANRMRPLSVWMLDEVLDTVV